MPAILFDLDDTLYDQAIPFCAAYENVFLRRWEVPAEQLFAASRHYGDQVFEKARTEEISMEEMYRYRIQKAFEDFQIQITDDEAMEFQRSYAENQMGLIKEDTYYVGDSFDNDITGASKAGWNTIWMNRRKRENKNQTIKPDICVSDEKELYQVMEQVLDP